MPLKQLLVNTHQNLLKSTCYLASPSRHYSHSTPQHRVKVEQRHRLTTHDTVRADIVIIGAGILGTAISSRLVKEFPNHVLLEKMRRPGQGISSRNSEVIHAGLYYKEGSLKADLCRDGQRLMYQQCRKWGIPHSRCGKWLVASSPKEHEYLENLKKHNDAAGVVKLRWIKYAGRDMHENFDSNYVSRLTSIEKIALEHAFTVLESCDSGIVDSSALMDTFLRIPSTGVTALSEDELGTHVFNTEVLDIVLERPEEFTLIVRTGEDIYQVKSNIVINAAGLYSSQITQNLLRQVDPDHSALPHYNMHFAKGDYFSYQSSEPNLVNRLIYPVPDKEVTSLGVHLTIDLSGEIRFGPDIQYLGTDISQVHYRVDEKKRDAFYNSITKYIPEGIERDRLRPAYAGVRPKLQGPGEPFRDFMIAEESKNGVKGLVSLVGIESPGLTSSMAIANRVARLLGCKDKYDFR